MASDFSARLRSAPDERPTCRVNGYTLVELSVVLALVSIMVAMAVGGTTRLMASTRIEALANTSRQAILTVDAVYRARADFSGLTTRQLVALRALPSTVISQPGTDAVIVRHTLGGTLSAHWIESDVPGRALAWGMYIDTVPTSACGELLITLEPLSAALALMPTGQSANWQDSLRLSTVNNRFTNAGVPVTFVKNLGGSWSAAAAGAACNTTAPEVAVLSLRTRTY